MFEFSQLEYALRYHVAEEIRLQERYFAPIMTHDFALLCSVVLEVLCPPHADQEPCVVERREKIEDIVKRCHKLNNERVRVAHGLWVPSLEGGTVHHASRSRLRVQTTIRQAEHLEAKADEANALRMQFEKLMLE